MKVTGLVIALFLLLASGAEAACTVSTTPVNFGAYDVFSTAPLDALGTISVSCTGKKKKKIKVTISIGQSPNSGSFNPRQMKHTTLADLLDYNLYTNKKRTKIWGDGTGGTSVVKKKVKANKTKVFKVYGRIPPLQDVSAGSYLDTLTVTIVF